MTRYLPIIVIVATLLALAGCANGSASASNGGARANMVLGSF